MENMIMFWKKKKKSNEGLPNLPVPPNMTPTIQDYNRSPSIPVSTTEPKHPEHPTFPDHPDEHKLDLPPIHSPSQEPLPKLPEFNKSIEIHKTQEKPYKVIEMEEWHPQENQITQPISPVAHPKPLPIELHETPSLIPPTPATHTESPNKHPHHNKPIFVKIDKFRSARESLEIVKEKLTEIDELLKMIREVKLKEDRELSAWEKEMENIKSRINDVAVDIFENSYYG